MNTNLSQKIEEFTKSFYAAERVKPVQDQEYQKIFASEGGRKSSYMLEDLREKAQKLKLDLTKFSLLSLGGADGSELEEILLKTPIRHAALLEMSPSACKIARKKAEKLSRKDKTIDVFEGDAISRLDDAFDGVRAAKSAGLIVSAQAILHELPSRSDSYKDTNRLLGKLFGFLPTTIFYAREPCKPREWPEEVEVNIPGVSGATLLSMLQLVGAHMRLSTSHMQVQPDDFVLGNGELVVEVLHKLLRCRSVAEFKYEMGERLTSFDGNDVRQLLLAFCKDPANVSVDWTTTEGFRESYASAGVQARETRSSKISLPVPDTHVRIRAIRITGGKLAKPRRIGVATKLSQEPESEDRAQLPVSKGSHAPPVTPRFTRRNRIRNCAELNLLPTQGSSKSSFDLLAEVRFGKENIPVEDFDVEFGLTEAILKLRATGCRPDGIRLGDDAKHPYVAAESGNKWRILGPFAGGAVPTLTGNPLGGESLCQMDAGDEQGSISARLTLSCSKYHIKYVVKGNSQENAMSPTEEAILAAFLNKCLHTKGKSIELGRAQITWKGDSDYTES